MRYWIGLAVMAGGILVGHADPAKAQVSFSFGNPYGSGPYVTTGQPYSGYYGTGYRGYPNTYQPGYGQYQPGYGQYQPGYGQYQPGYGQRYVIPGTTSYNSGYRGYITPYTPGYQTYQIYTGAYGYPGNYGYGSAYGSPYGYTGNQPLNRAQAIYGAVRAFTR